MSVQEQLIQILSSPKVAAPVSAITAGTGVGAILGLVPLVFGALAALAGFTLSVVLIYFAWRIHRVKYKTAKLEYNTLKAKEAERLEDARQREAGGLPIRRGEDSAT